MIAPHEAASRKDKGKRLLANYIKTKPTDWTQVDNLVIKVCNQRLPPEYQKGPVSYMKVQQFVDSWCKGTFDTPTVNAVPTVATVNAVPVPASTSIVPSNSFGDTVLFPEQYDTFCRLYSSYMQGDIVGALQNGNTGSGKTYLALALIHAFAKHSRLHEQDLVSRLRMVPYIIFTRKTIVDQWREVARNMGLGDLLASGKLQILPYSHLSSSMASKFVTKEYDAFENKWRFIWHPQAVPLAVVFDECQGLCNPDTTQTQCFTALLNAASNLKCYTLLMSATPADTVAKAGAFISSFRKPIKIGSASITVRSAEDWQKEYAYLICEEPTKSNNAAMKRLREAIDPYVFEIENVKWPARARNRSLVVDFKSSADREKYDNFYKAYLEMLEKMHREENDSPFQQWIAINVFRKGVEPMRNAAAADRIQHNLSRKVATAVGVNYKCTVTDLVFQLEQHGIHRNQISIIWGGGEDYDAHNTFDEKTLNKYVEDLRNGVPVSKSTLDRMKKTIAFREDMVKSGESEAERFKRYDDLRKLGMTGSQSHEQRWQEIRRFQTGVTKICIFTLASGGVGLSLDQNKPDLWPRELIAGLCLSGPDFKQVLGRLVRRGTMPGYVDQYMMFMRDTVEDKVLKPIIERKLANIKELATRGIDPTEITMNSSGKITHQEMTLEELNKVADSDDSQLTPADLAEDEDEDETVLA